jgi:3-deoxy-manno-octulosonate cytidylyltransferase (CMP-KDO synthetase)
MIVRTYQCCVRVFPREDVFVATNAIEIAAACKQHKIQVLMTKSTHLTGTDRVAEASMLVHADVYIDVQGDEPLFDIGDLALIRDFAITNPRTIANGYCPIREEKEFLSPNTPKVVFDQQERLIYMSRSPIPGTKDGRFRFGFRQVCAYAYPADALTMIVDHPSKTPLEEAEDIEILRFLELGASVRMLAMSDRSIPVDSPEDVGRVVAAMRSRALI